MRYVKVDGHTNLVRDLKTNSIINTNMNEYQKYLSMKQSKSNDDKKIEVIENDLNNIKNDINEIKSLLRSLANESR